MAFDKDTFELFQKVECFKTHEIKHLPKLNKDYFKDLVCSIEHLDDIGADEYNFDLLAVSSYANNKHSPLQQLNLIKCKTLYAIYFSSQIPFQIFDVKNIEKIILRYCDLKPVDSFNFGKGLASLKHLVIIGESINEYGYPLHPDLHNSLISFEMRKIRTIKSFETIENIVQPISTLETLKFDIFYDAFEEFLASPRDIFLNKNLKSLTIDLIPLTKLHEIANNENIKTTKKQIGLYLPNLEEFSTNTNFFTLTNSPKLTNIKVRTYRAEHDVNYFANFKHLTKVVVLTEGVFNLSNFLVNLPTLKALEISKIFSTILVVKIDSYLSYDAITDLSIHCDNFEINEFVEFKDCEASISSNLTKLSIRIDSHYILPDFFNKYLKYFNIGRLENLYFENRAKIYLTDIQSTFKFMKKLKSLNLVYRFADCCNGCTIFEKCTIYNNKLIQDRFCLRKNYSDFFVELVGLEHLSIHGLDFLEGAVIQKDFLKGLTNLKTLSLKQGNIRSIDRYSFDDLINLEMLDLSHNENLRKVPVDLFEKLTELKCVNFENVFLNNDMDVLFKNNKKLDKINYTSRKRKDSHDFSKDECFDIMEYDLVDI